MRIRPKFPAASVVLSLVLSLHAASPALADDAAKDPPDREKTLDLCEKGNLLEALPALKQLFKDDPEDAPVAEKLALAILMSTHTTDDVDRRKALRVEARKVLLDAKKNGDNSNFLQVLLEGLPEDGSYRVFSKNKDANNAMDRGELEFAQGKNEEAIKSYQKALLLDPKCYEAALFTGDMYFRLKKYKDAGEWFDQAIKIEPNCETAYRYWGDALIADGKPAEARDKFIDAIIANPYTRASWIGLKQWAEKNDSAFVMMRWEPPAPDADASKAEAAVTKSYRETRDNWKSGKFKQRFPDAEYRRSLPEETEALTSMLDAAGKLAKDEQPDLSEEVQWLQQVKTAGLLEAYVVLIGAERGIAQDYDAFRRTDRARLRKFIEQFVLREPKQAQ